MSLELHFYQTTSGQQPFVAWLQGLNDRQARARIQARLARVAVGNIGDAKLVGESVVELRIDWGPGYRVYFSRVGRVIVLLVCGGDKRTKQRDIRRAESYLEDFKRRSTKGPGRGA